MAPERIEDVLAAMERVVEEATQGPWEVGHDGPSRPIIIGPRYEREEEDAKYVATFDPPTLTALLAVARTARRALVHWTAQEGREESSRLTAAEQVDVATCDVAGEGCQALSELRDALDALTRPPQGAGGEG